MPRNIIIPYDPALKDRARELRKNATVSERILWQAIRGKRLGVEFHRQVPLDKFIVDFYCHELMLAIEIDGVTHGTEEARERDLVRQARLESLGVSFLRFHDGDVKENLEGVLAEIESWVLRHKGTSPFREADPLGGKSPFEGGLDLFPPFQGGLGGMFCWPLKLTASFMVRKKRVRGI